MTAPRSNVRLLRLVRSLLKTGTIYGLAGWIYIALNAVIHPRTLSLPLTHILPFPREDTFGIICFGFSTLSFFLLNLMPGEGERRRGD
jgi:hypothetical protein